MRYRHAVFSVALFIAIIGVAIVSAFNENDLFGDIAQALTLPLLILSLVNALAAIPSKAIKKCSSNIRWLELILPNAVSLYNWEKWRVDTLTSDDDNDEYSSEFNKSMKERQDAVDYIKLVIEHHKGTISRLNLYEKTFTIVYIFALCFLISSGFLATMIAPHFEFVTLPIFTFIAIIIFIADVLFGDMAVDGIKNYFYRKIARQHTAA